MSPQAIAHYRITAKLGAGGMGEVYRATDTKLGREAAIKILPDAFAQDTVRMARFAREAQVLASLNHPNIAAIYGVEDRAIVMELVEGPTLAGPLPIETALAYARQIAEALEAAHEKGIIHRDLKPANVKVRPDGMVKVLDFGLAKLSEDPSAADDGSNSPTVTMSPTRAGWILGTAAYMSPEQAKGKTVDRRTDIWAFGVVLMEMLTGRNMYSGETVPETLASVIKDQPDFDRLPRETPIPIRRLLRRCLDKDSHRRLRDIGEARIAIEEALEGGSAEEESAAVPRPRRAFPWGVATVLAIALAALAFLHFRESRSEPPVVRFTIAPPEKTAFNIMGPAVLSRDGSRIAFSTTSVDGMSRLWIRSLDSLNGRPLAGTEGATFPFWPPDGAFIGFFAGGKLKKVDVSGGRVASICDAYAGVGGTWNQNGVIVFAPAGVAALQKVSASGGTPSAVTKPESSLNGHRWPWFLPDGRRFLYLSRNGPTSSIRVGSIDSSEDKALFANQFNAVYAQGYLLFLRDSNLMAQPFDTNRLATTGEAVPAVEGIQANLGWQRGVFSVSNNGLLIFGTGKSAGAQLAWFDRRGTPLGFLGDPGEINETEFSPDRKHMTVAIIDPATRNRDIWILDVFRGIPRRFTFDPAEERRAIWSPDGQTVIFNSARQGHFDLYRKAFRGAGAEERLYADESDKYPETWSPNSKFLLYETVSLNPKQKRALWILPDPGGKAAERKPAPFPSGPDNHSNGQFSPDGQWIAYQSDESARYEIYVTPFPGAGGKRQISAAGGDQPRWRGDGKEIFYMSPENRLMAADVSTGAVTPLFATPFVRAGGMNYDVSADGQRFLVRILPSRTDADPIAVVQNWVAGLKK